MLNLHRVQRCKFYILNTQNTSISLSESRKEDHIDLAFKSAVTREYIDSRFSYEPMLSPHPPIDESEFSFLGKKMKYPIWVSSMTGGAQKAGIINKNLAQAVAEFGLGMGLGSCRILLEDDKHFNDFNLRPLVGERAPFYANLGIAQVEQSLKKGNYSEIKDLVTALQCDGLIVHVNPMQEWLQPEGDLITESPIETIKELINLADFPIIIKEVGQGFGYESMKALLQLPLAAVDFAAHGGTNFAMLELLRANPVELEVLKSLTKIGHSATEMVDMANEVMATETNIIVNQLIISGGVSTFLDGYYLIKKSKIPAIYGQASGFLKHSLGEYIDLKKYVEAQIKGLKIASTFLKIKD